MEQVRRPLFRLRLESGRAVRVPVRVTPGMRVLGTAVGIEVIVAGRAACAPDDGDLGAVPSALALLRTVFEDHHVDPDHQSCLFFNGCTIGTCTAQYDFSVTRAGDAVLLSDFTFPQLREQAPVRVPIALYAREVVNFAHAALDVPVPAGLAPWAEELHGHQRNQVEEVLHLAEAFVAQGCRNISRFYAEFQRRHGCRKRPLELQILSVEARGDALGQEASDTPLPWLVEARVLFGPISVNELVPMRVNGGDVVLVQGLRFGPRGISLAVMGVGSGGLAAGDRLTGLQLFYA